MNQLLIICGPTATGKTSLALKLAKKLNGELISADSRQVYKGMNIGTGKDIPKFFKFQLSNLQFLKKKIPFYGNGTKMWGYDLVNPSDDFSASHFTQIAWIIIKHLWKQNKLPIFVGGTGLYLSSLLKPPRSLHIPINKKLRKGLSSLDVSALQQELNRLNPKRFRQMNQSDKNNSRRLVRAIEIASLNQSSVIKHQINPTSNVCWIGLTAPLTKLDKHIDERVLDRINLGMTKEVKALKSVLKNKSLPASTSTGYHLWLKYLENQISKSTAIKLWQTKEYQYARRQLTWFKKQKQIHWFDITQFAFQNKVVEVVKTWYAKN